MIPQSASLSSTAPLSALRAASQLPPGAAGIRPSGMTPRHRVAAIQRLQPSGFCRGTPQSASCRRLPGLANTGRKAEHGSCRGSRALDVRCGAGRRWFQTEGPHGQGAGGQSEFGPFPWEQDYPGAWAASDDGALEVVTLVTSEGVYRLPSRVRAAAPAPGEAQARRARREEKEYMDPLQQLCLGAVFDIKAINGVSRGRYFRVDGFCRSVQMLNDVIADVVEEEGGEILCADVSSTGGLHERLHIKVVMPLLWGVPPKRDTLRKAIHEGGGIVHRCFQEWQFM